MTAFADANVAYPRSALMPTNPFRQVEQTGLSYTVTTSFDYVVGEKRVHVARQQYECYELIWSQLPHPLLGVTYVEGKRSKSQIIVVH